MKKMTVLVGALLIMTILHAQNQKSKMELGVQFAGIGVSAENNSSVTDGGEIYDFKTRLSWKGGITSKFYLGSSFYFAPEFSVLSKGGKIDQYYDYGDGTNIKVKGNARFTFLEMPLNLMAVIPGNMGHFYIGMGPSLSYGVDGRIHLKAMVPVDNGNGVPVYVEAAETFDVKFDGKKADEVDDEYVHYKAFELGGNLVTGYQLQSGLFVKAMANYSFSDIDPNAGYETKNWYFGLGLGYNLKLK